MSISFDACIASPITSAGVFIVTTKDAVLYGLCVSGSVNATVVNVHAGGNTAGAKVFMCNVAATSPSNDGPYTPVVCANGIAATNIGTLASYVVYYAELHP